MMETGCKRGSHKLFGSSMNYCTFLPLNVHVGCFRTELLFIGFVALLVEN